MVVRNEIKEITIERVTVMLHDIIWIGINSYPNGGSAHPVKFLINRAIDGKSQSLVLDMAACTTGAVMMCRGLALHWQHVYKEAKKMVVIEFTITGRDIDEVEYASFINNAKNYFDHLSKTGSRTF